MGLDAIARRRWLGGVVLLCAAAMLVCGETIFKGHLSPRTFLVYWLGCFLLLGLSIIIAFRDLRDLQQRTRRQHRELLESTLKEIENESKTLRAGQRSDRP